MKSKFVSLILSLAVILGLMLVPAALPGVGMVAASNNVTISVQPSLTKVGCNDTFNLTVEVDNPDAVPISTVAARLDFGTTCFDVTGVTSGGVLTNVLLNQYDNGNGTIDYDAGILGGNTTSTTVLVCTISCVTKCVTGSSLVEFVYTGGPPPRQTAVQFGATDYLESGNMALMYNATVKCGSPQLTVDVSPAGKGDVEINGVAPGSYPDVSSWSWDEVVGLEAIDSVAGWTFHNWTGDLTGSTNPDTITMSDAKSVTANFVELPCDLDVDPNILNLTARWGANEDNDTVTIANDGGHTVCWALGTPPDWTPGDYWSYWNTYDEAPPGNPFPNPYWSNLTPCPVNNTLLNLTVVGEDADNYYCIADWPITDPQRTAKTGMWIPVCLQDAQAAVDKCTLDYVWQLANLTLYLPGPVVGQALVSWSYDSCHGWPYYLGKTWNYNMTITDALGTTVTPAQAMVTNASMSMGGFTDVVEITHGSPNLGGTIFMQQYWSDTLRNFVYQWDGGTFVAPPLDQRILTGFSVSSPPAAAPPSWLSFDKTHGALGIGASEDLTVTANSSGLNVSTYSGNFTISACCGSIQSEVVDVNFIVTPATTIDVCRELPADALSADAERPGDTFWVNITFQAPVDDFNSIGLTDFAPPGWLVATDDAWCTPAASWNKSNYNKAEYAWAGPYAAGQNITARYQVTIPATASAGINEWPACMETCGPCGECSNINNYCAWVEYWFGAQGPFESSICCDYQKIVTVPGCVVGETRDVNADLLDTVTVVLYEEPAEMGDEPEDSDASTIIPTPVNMTDAGGNFTTWYENCADDTGYYYQVASKYCYYTIDSSNMSSPRNASYPDYIDWSTPALLAAGYRMDFEADYGLICKGADMSYAMESVNHWLFVPIDQYGAPHTEWQIHSWKAMESIHSWQYPCGCGCV